MIEEDRPRRRARRRKHAFPGVPRRAARTDARPPRRGYGGTALKHRRITSLIICALLLVCLVRPGVYASDGPSLLSVDGQCASVTLVDLSGPERVSMPVFSADASVVCSAPQGVEYDRSTNTLTLSDLGGAAMRLELVMMGSDFKIRLCGSSSLESIRSASMGWGGSIEFCGEGSLVVSCGDGPAVLVEASGMPDFVRVGPQLRLSLISASGVAVEVRNSSLAQGVISFDTASPDVVEYDGSRRLTAVLEDGNEYELCTRAGFDGFWIEKAYIVEESETIAYDLYLLGGKNDEGVCAAELVEQGLSEPCADLAPAFGPHDHTLCPRGSEYAAPSVCFARFTVSDVTIDPNGSVTVPSAVSRGGSAVVRTAPAPGYKTEALLIDGTEVALSDGAYTIWGMSSDHTAEARFVEAVPASVSLTAPAVTEFTVPAEGEDFISEPFSALVRDADGDIVGADVEWSLSPETEGVSIGADGRVRVSSAAKDAVGSEPISLAVTASVRGTELAGSADVSVGRAEPRAVSVEILRGGEPVESDEITVPAEGETKVEYTARVLDQYGEPMKAECLWSAYGVPEGVETSDGRITVSSGCVLRAEIKLTASVGDISDELSVSVLIPEPPRGETGGNEAGGGETGGGETGGNEAGGSETGGGETGGNETGGGETGGSETGGGETGGNETGGGETGGGETGSGETGGGAPQGDAPAVPVIIWPNAEIKQGQTYGISWDELVTLSGGSARLGDSDIEGAFALEHDSELPNVSDSFSVIFLSADGEYRAVSPAYGVTLEPRALSDEMVSARPASVNYSGAAQTPAAAVSCDGRELREGVDFTVVGYSDNVEPGAAVVTVEGIGNYSGRASAGFTIERVPGGELAVFISSCLPEDSTTEPTVTVRSGSTLLEKGKDYDLGFSYDIPAKIGTAVITLKGNYSGTLAKSFDLPNYLVVEGAGSSWSKSSVVAMSFRANGAVGKFTGLTVDGRAVDSSLYTVESCSTIVKISPSFLKTLSDGKHIVGFVYKDGKALAIFSITGASRKGVPTGDGDRPDLPAGAMCLSLGSAAAAAWALKKRKKA